MTKVLLPALVLCMALLVVPLACQRMENPSVKFSNFDEMEASGYLESGWVPPYIPRSATDIAETHNLDTHIVRMSFHYQLGDTTLADKQCESRQTQNATIYDCTEGTLTLLTNGFGHFTSK